MVSKKNPVTQVIPSTIYPHSMTYLLYMKLIATRANKYVMIALYDICFGKNEIILFLISMEEIAK